MITEENKGSATRKTNTDDGMLPSPKGKGVLIIYTGGTIGCIPSDPSDPKNSPLVVAKWSVLEEQLPSLAILKKEFPVEVYPFEPAIDSTNMKPKYWQLMAEVIEQNYEKYDGFVILHGTDTMAYTASALSFMLVNLNKPVIITGSQLPIAGRPRNDGEQNLMTAIMIANGAYYGLPIVPEVCVFFRDKLLRGNRTRKVSADGYAGFDSMNYPALGDAGEHIVINANLLRSPPAGHFHVRKRLDENVINFSIFPGVQESPLLREVIRLDGLRGMVLQTYGTGNAPTEEVFLDTIEEASTKRELVVLDVTQCNEGAVELGTYETSMSLLERGVVGAADITPEAAMCKLMVLLGNEDLKFDTIRELVQQNIAGEQSLSVFTSRYEEKIVTLTAGGKYRIPGVAVPSQWTDGDLKMAVLRLREITLTSPDAGDPLEIHVYLGLSSDDKMEPSSPHYAGMFKRHIRQTGNTLVFDITQAFQKVAAAGKMLPLTIALAGKPDQTLKWKRAELVLQVDNCEVSF